jgi:23S rRNA (cytosine1962-C5)-methyltransferase
MKPITLTVKNKALGPVIGRHPWVFSGGLEHIPEGLTPGTPVLLANQRGEFLAQGYFGGYSQIAVRVWSYDEQEKPDASFFSQRIERALRTRETFLAGTDTNAYRLINSENDFLPGLIVDRYADYLAIQFHTQGIEAWKDLIIKSLLEILEPKGVYERSDALGRRHEALPSTVGLLHGEVPDQVSVMENGISFLVDIKHGQKTGFFLDQRDKRKALQKYSPGKKVLNTFSYTGGFSLYALQAGAERVVSVDVSQPALDLAVQALALNGLDHSKAEFVCADVKDYLKTLTPGEFDVIILDPPAFIKDRHKKAQGIKGYQYINDLAVKNLSHGQVLVSCSCSAHLTLEELRKIVLEAGAKNKKSLQILETFTHGLDHPQLVSFSEGEYLKVIFCLISE